MQFAYLLMQLTVDQIGAVIGIISALAVVGTLLWNASRKQAKSDLKTENLEGKHEADVKRIEEKIASKELTWATTIKEMEKEILQKISDQRAERKEEIAKALSNNRAEAADFQAQITGIRSDMKDASTRITTLDTKVNHHAEGLHEGKADKLELKMFFENKYERLEDRVAKGEDFVKNTLVEFFSRERAKTLSGRR